MLGEDPRAAEILRGFQLDYLKLTDAGTGKVLWKSDGWGREVFYEEKVAEVPKSLLHCKAVSREICFSSVQSMKDFRCLQRVLLHDTCIEEWSFTLGFVMPETTNTWENTIVAANEMLPVEVLSGNVTIESWFFDADLFISKSVVRLFYV